MFNTQKGTRSSRFAGGDKSEPEVDQGVLLKGLGSEKVGRVTPCAPQSYVIAKNHGCRRLSDGAHGVARPTSMGFGQPAPDLSLNPNRIAKVNFRPTPTGLLGANLEPTPPGLRLKAQGCSFPTTLGKNPTRVANPKGVAPASPSPVRRERAGVRANLFCGLRASIFKFSARHES
jgi:hypothetical protein